MRIKNKILDYFRIYWRRGRFLKAVSLLVLSCFMVNIIQPGMIFASTEDDLRNKQIKRVDSANAVVSNMTPETVNRQVSLGTSRLDESLRMEMSRQDITVNTFGNIIEKTKGSDKPLGTIDEEGNVIASFDKNGKIDKDKVKIQDLQCRVDQFFEAGGVKGGDFKATVAEEYRDRAAAQRQSERSLRAVSQPVKEEAVKEAESGPGASS